MSKIPFRPMDGTYLKDDFLTNEATADATVGELDWELTTIGNASTTALLVTTNTVAGRPGILRDTTAGTADGDGEAYRLLADQLVLKAAQRFSLSVAFRYPDISGNQLAGNDFRFGLGDSVTATAQTVGIGFLADAGVITLFADSGDHGDVNVAAAQPAGNRTLTSGTTAVLGTWHTIEIEGGGGTANAQGGPASARIIVDGIPAGALNGTIVLDDDEEMEFGFTHYQNSGGAATLEVDVDFVDLLIYGRG